MAILTEREQKYRAHFRNIGKHLHKNDYLPINLKKHPCEFRIGRNAVLVDWGWAARTERGDIIISSDEQGNPKPYEGFWEARCFGCAI